MHMFSNLLVGVDGRQAGRDAIELARRLAGPEARLTLAHVYSSFPGRGASEALAIEREESEQLLKRERARASLDARLAVRGDRPVGQGLHELAQQLQADVLVVGSSRRALLGRVLLGDDTCASLDGAPCAVAVAPAGYAVGLRPMREIGVGYNGSPESEHALDFARRLAGELHTRLSACVVVSVRAAAYTFSGGLPPQEDIEELVDTARRRLASIDGVEPRAAYGQPAEELALYSASLDLLLVGSRGYGPLGRVVHGSTSRQLARSARCPLLVLTRSTRNAYMPA
jgi:nucleotide-binding universal stress UspA family protein